MRDRRTADATSASSPAHGPTIYGRVEPAANLSEHRTGWASTLWRILALLGVVIFIVCLALWLVALVTAVVGTVWIAHWHARSFGYRCPKCRHAFVITTLWDLVTPQSLDPDARKYLICPSCGHVAWMPIRRRRGRRTVSSTSAPGRPAPDEDLRPWR